MPTITKKLKISNNGVLANVGSISYYKTKSKDELINEIFNLQDQLEHCRVMENNRKIKQNNCIIELNHLLNNK